MRAVPARVIEQESGLDRFRGLVDEHSRRIFRLAYRITGNEQDAEDVVQETFVRIYRHIGRIRADRDPAPWIQRIAANCAADVLRKRGRSRAAKQDPLEGHLDLPSPEPGPDRRSFSAEVRTAVRRELGALTAKERTAFVLRHYEGLSIREIVRITGTGENTVKNHIFRAVRKLRRALAPLLEGTP